MSHSYNDEAKERVWESIEDLTDAEVLDQLLETSTWRSLEGADEMLRDDSYRIALFNQIWNHYCE